MYTYTVSVTYIGSNAFMVLLWPRLVRKDVIFRFSFVSNPTTVQALRTAGIAAGFAFSDILRVPVVVPEVVP